MNKIIRKLKISVSSRYLFLMNKISAGYDRSLSVSRFSHQNLFFRQMIFRLLSWPILVSIMFKKITKYKRLNYENISINSKLISSFWVRVFSSKKIEYSKKLFDNLHKFEIWETTAQNSLSLSFENI